MTSKYLHLENNGCELEAIENKFIKHKELTTTTPRRYKCKTHNVEVCHCGWEFGHHYEGNDFYTKPSVPCPRFKIKPHSGLTKEEELAMQKEIDKGSNSTDVLRAGGKCAMFKERFLISL
jgi:hypothetical protein